MKRLFLIISVMFLFGCDQLTDSFLSDCAKGHDLYYTEEWDSLNSFHDIGDWMRENIEYRSDDVYCWSNPRDTVRRGYGDCNDKALLFANMAYFVMGIKMDIVVVKQSEMESDINWSGAIEGGGIVDHCMVRYDGQIYNMNGSPYKGPVGYSYSFDFCFR